MSTSRKDSSKEVGKKCPHAAILFRCSHRAPVLKHVCGITSQTFLCYNMRKTITRDVKNDCFYCLLDDEEKHKALDELPALNNKGDVTETIKWQALGYLNCGVDDPQAGKETLILLYNTYQVNMAIGSKDDKEAKIAAAAVDKLIESNATAKVNAATAEADRILEAEWDKIDQSDSEFFDEDWTMV